MQEKYIVCSTHGHQVHGTAFIISHTDTPQPRVKLNLEIGKITDIACKQYIVSSERLFSDASSIELC